MAKRSRKRDLSTQLSHSIKAEKGESEMEASPKGIKNALESITGIKTSELASHILDAASNALAPIVGAGESLNAIAQSLHDAQSKDAIEARLVTQIAISHTYAMKSIKRAGEADMLCHIEAMTNLGIKLMRVHNETVEVLSRYRRGGVQQVIVQHQNNIMADKAVINNVTGVG